MNFFDAQCAFFGGGGPGCVKVFFVRGQIWEDYGFEILVKIPVLYQVLKIKKLNFCCCTVHLRGGPGCVKIFLGGCVSEAERLWT